MQLQNLSFSFYARANQPQHWGWLGLACETSLIDLTSLAGIQVAHQLLHVKQLRRVQCGILC